MGGKVQDARCSADDGGGEDGLRAVDG